MSEQEERKLRIAKIQQLQDELRLVDRVVDIELENILSDSEQRELLNSLERRVRQIKNLKDLLAMTNMRNLFYRLKLDENVLMSLRDDMSDSKLAAYSNEEVDDLHDKYIFRVYLNSHWKKLFRDLGLPLSFYNDAGEVKSLDDTVKRAAAMGSITLLHEQLTKYLSLFKQLQYIKQLLGKPAEVLIDVSLPSHNSLVQEFKEQRSQLVKNIIGLYRLTDDEKVVVKRMLEPEVSVDYIPTENIKDLLEDAQKWIDSRKEKMKAEEEFARAAQAAFDEARAREAAEAARLAKEAEEAAEAMRIQQERARAAEAERRRKEQEKIDEAIRMAKLKEEEAARAAEEAKRYKQLAIKLNETKMFREYAIDEECQTMADLRKDKCKVKFVETLPDAETTYNLPEEEMCDTLNKIFRPMKDWKPIRRDSERRDHKDILIHGMHLTEDKMGTLLTDEERRICSDPSRALPGQVCPDWFERLKSWNKHLTMTQMSRNDRAFDPVKDYCSTKGRK